MSRCPWSTPDPHVDHEPVPGAREIGWDLGVVYITHDLATAYYVRPDRIMFREYRGDGRCGKGFDGSQASVRQAPAGMHPWTNPRNRWKTKVQLAETDAEST
jgi:hypothetical protein